MRPRFHPESGPNREGEGRPVELVRVRRAQRDTGDEGYRVKARARRRGGRGRRRGKREGSPAPAQSTGFFGWLKSLFGFGRKEEDKRPRRGSASLDQQEKRVLEEFQNQFGITFRDPGLLKLALTHRSYLSVTGQGPRESNERLEFLGDSVLGLVTSEYLYRRHPDEHEGQLTKTKSLLVSKAILSRRALRMGLGRYVLMSHSEVESGGRQRLSILADAFESVLGAVYLDQGFEVAREYIHKHLLAESDSIVADKRHTNYKSHLQEYVQSTYRTHPVYRIRSENGPDHSKHFMVEVMVGRRTLGEGRGHNKKEAEQAAARDALERVEKVRGGTREETPEPPRERAPVSRPRDEAEEGDESGEGRRRRRGRRGGRGRRDGAVAEPQEGADAADLDVVHEQAAPEEPEELLELASHEPVGVPDDIEPFDDDEYDEVEVGAGTDSDPDAEEVDDLDDEDDEDDDTDDDESDDEVDEDDEDEDEEDDEDDEHEPETAGMPSVATLTPPVSPGIAATSTAPAPPAPSAPSAPASMAWGRATRKVVRGAASAAAPATAAADVKDVPAPTSTVPVAPAPAPAREFVEPESVSPHEELLVDPFDMQEEDELAPVVEVLPPPAVDVDDEEEVDARIEEMERAMANFGQRKGSDPPPKRANYGRRGRKR
ncbi:MAG: ribonuclease III [Candidatus Eisenbacteria bacterium]|uniref:Ribonuclease 3 n=1 Tax=Eiseniibacteriota bacterium TaxID=2212470 RepID=A0A933SC51_UNCEI|nr:ribonuclease III [Candidatus Eisenbacteria bacterium]